VPATNYTPIQFYRSTTSGNVPSAANLSPGELALNIADDDMTMYFENASGVVKRFFNNPAALKYPPADGTSSQGIKTDGSKALSFGDLASAAITNITRQAVTSSATTTIDLASGQVIDLTMAASITSLSFTNVPASGTPILVQIVVKNASDGTAYTIAWPNSVYWSGQYAAASATTVQTAPTLATGANGVTVIALLTTDGGTKWRGWVMICASKAEYEYNEVIAISGTGNSHRMMTVLGAKLHLMLTGHAIAIGYLSDCRPMTPADEDAAFVQYRPGLWCHVYTGVRAIAPLPWKGSQGWREVSQYFKNQIKFLEP